ncbi:9484_t:CDS:1, partial [Gigaspora margarita]
TDNKSKTSLEEIIPFNSYLEASNDKDNKSSVEITSFNFGRKFSDDIFISSSSRTSSLAISEDQLHLKKNKSIYLKPKQLKYLKPK